MPHQGTIEGRKERLKTVNNIEDTAEPFFYMAFVLKGTAQQYLDLLKYAKKQNGARIIYQNRSLTYLYISNKDPKKCKTAPPEFLTKLDSSTNV
ncbi:MAG: hypothetical protein NWF06_01115 [Candidatus Bathyarchaeota archaeon]|nr:hypothetical protein [Candidatus Bathyarchaeum sp.]